MWANERPTLAEWPVSDAAAAVVCYLGSGIMLMYNSSACVVHWCGACARRAATAAGGAVSSSAATTRSAQIIIL